MVKLTIVAIWVVVLLVLGAAFLIDQPGHFARIFSKAIRDVEGQIGSWFSQIPLQVREAYGSPAPRGQSVFFASLEKCKKDDSIIYKVSRSGGFVVDVEYFDSKGKSLGTHQVSDVVLAGHSPIPPVDLSQYRCETVVKNH